MSYKPFEPLALPHKTPAQPMGNYRIYKGVGDFVVVSAATVQAALESSGIKDAVRVERNSLDKVAVLAPKLLADAAGEEKLSEPPSAAAAELPVTA